ncbi:MAG: NADH-quinone oxidoreductase subunit A [Bdellovibrionales bacterium]|nr:NADH-quinone oxidoreductase subunit A [Bdellovibrionales bacterium]
MNSLFAIGIVVLVAATVIGLLMSIAHLITRYTQKPANTQSDSDKDLPYECGLIGTPAQSSRIPSGYYLTAILFVLFDIEIIFLYPWAIAYRDFLSTGDGLGYLTAFIIFLLLFILGLFWEIRVKALNWK